MPYGLIPLLLWTFSVGAIAFCAISGRHTFDFDPDQVNTSGIVLACYLPFALLFCNSAGTRFASIFVVYALLEIDFMRELYDIYDDPTTFMARTGMSEASADAFLIIGIVVISLHLIPFLLPMRRIRILCAYAGVPVHGVILYQLYGDPLSVPSTPEDSFTVQLYMFVLFASAAMMVMVTSLPDHETVGFLVKQWSRGTFPLCSTRLLEI